MTRLLMLAILCAGLLAVACDECKSGDGHCDGTMKWRCIGGGEDDESYKWYKTQCAPGECVTREGASPICSIAALAETELAEKLHTCIGDIIAVGYDQLQVTGCLPGDPTFPLSCGGGSSAPFWEVQGAELHFGHGFDEEQWFGSFYMTEYNIGMVADFSPTEIGGPVGAWFEGDVVLEDPEFEGCVVEFDGLKLLAHNH